jgi:hypothetical protein
MHVHRLCDTYHKQPMELGVSPTPTLATYHLSVKERKRWEFDGPTYMICAS